MSDYPGAVTASNSAQIDDLVGARVAVHFKDPEAPNQNGSFRHAPEEAFPRARKRVRRKRFAARTAGKARTAAGEWLRDFTRHGPLQIQKIATREYQDEFLTVVTFTAA
jgi:hypothetical protein